MNRKTSLWILIVPFCLLFAIFNGCSGNSSSPLNPSATSTGIEDARLPVGVSERFPDGTPAAGYGFLGLYTIKVDPLSLKGDISSLRTGSVEDVLEIVDITNFMQIAPCTNCVKLESVALDPDGHLVLSIGVKHPFPAGDPMKPITGRNRGDLHVFNVEGIVVSDGTGATVFPGLGVTVGDIGFVNADGATSYLDSSLDTIFQTESTVHPYKLHFDDFSNGNYDPANPMGFASVTDPPPLGHLVMPMGCDYDFKDYIFDITGSGQFDFIYAVGCTYALSSASKSQRFSPEYRLPQHNKKAATTVNVKIILNQLSDGDITSKAKLEISVVDVNHGIAVGTALNQMRADSSVKSIQIEVPGITSSAVSVPLAPSSGDGLTPATALVYPVEITNSAGGALGSYTGVVKVTDSCPSGLNVVPALDGKDGIKRVDPGIIPTSGTFDIPEFATYAVFRIPIENNNLPPVADLKPPTVMVTQGGTVSWDATGSTDPDGSIVLYEWDYVLQGGNPANFTADASGTSATQISAPYNTLGDYVAAVRVTDDLGATDIATADVSVVEHIPDLVLEAVRNNYLPTPGWQPSRITKVHLDWEDMPGAVEYAVYRSHLYASPYSWVLLGTTLPPTSVFDDTAMLTLNYVEWIDHKYIYEVRPRTIVGDPSSEGTPSQQALIFMESNNCNPAIPSAVAPYDPQQPNFEWRNGAGGGFNPQYSGNWSSDEPQGFPTLISITSYWPQPFSAWQIMYTGFPIPDISGQSVAYMDFAFTTGGWVFSNTLGFAPGTFTTIPNNGDAIFSDFDTAPASDYMLGIQYKTTFNSTAFQNFFGEPAGTQAFYSPYDPYQATRYKITRLLQPDVDYAAIGVADWQCPSVQYSYQIWESIGIVVY